jgi:hypothetical protein
MNSSSKLKQHSLSSFLMDDKKMDTTKNKQNSSKHEDLNTRTLDFHGNKALAYKLVKRESFVQKMFKSWSSKRMQEINRNKMAQETVEERKKRYGGFTNAIDAAIANVDKKFPKKEEKEKSNKTNLEKSKNVREQRKRIFGTNPNAPRLSDKRIKMMQAIRDYAQKKYGLDLKIAQGKRDKFGQIREDKKNQPAYDVFSPSGVLKEKALLQEYKKRGKKRTDPKPDWRSGNLETQPSPDAAIHELAHLNLAPEHTSLPQIQEEMDRQWGESQKKYGHLQQKKTRGEVQPMSIENPIRREIGLPANRSTKRVTQNQDVLDDPGQKRFVQGKNLKGKTVFYDRQSRLQNPETRERMQQIREGSLKFNPQTGWEKASDVNALINLRARGKYEEALKRIKERVGFNKMPKKLAASELYKVSSPKKGHTIAQLERLKQDNWYNPDTGTELDAEEAERYLKKSWPSAFAKIDKERKSLNKAIAPNDFKKIKSSHDKTKSYIVDHSSHGANHTVTDDDFLDHIVKSPEIFKDRSKSYTKGISPKNIFSVKSYEKDEEGNIIREKHKTFMIKPYHGHLESATKTYTKSPIKGWATLTTKDLLHAADMWHMAEDVSYYEYQGVPITVHKFNHNYEDLLSSTNKIHPLDLQKIAIMDYLTNNVDRNASNLMLSKNKFSIHKDSEFNNHKENFSHPLLIDHERNFQYNRGIRNKFGKYNPINGKDAISDYVWHSGLRLIASKINPYEMSEQADDLADWWNNNSKKIEETFDKNLVHIKDENLKNHIASNFKQRIKNIQNVFDNENYYEIFSPQSRLGEVSVGKTKYITRVPKKLAAREEGSK